MNATAEQIEAIQTIDRALLVEAGAGTGKTWVLVQRFLFLLGQHPDWPIDGIIAVTFTEKAAREMRTRIRHAVEQQADENSDNLIWQTRRRDLDRLQVGTIHSLCARILRENAIAAGLDPRFTVLDERQAVLLKEEAVEQALADLARGKGVNEAPARGPMDILASLQVRDLREQLAGLLSKRGTVQRLFEQLPSVKDLLASWQTGLVEMRRSLWQDALRNDPELGQAIADLPTITISDPLDKLADSVRLAQQGCQAIGQENLIAACGAWKQINLVGGKAANWGGKDLMDELKADLRRVRDLAKEWDKAGYLLEIGEIDQQAAQALQQWRALWLAVAEVYDQMKTERYALDFDDLELRVSQLFAQQPRSERLQAYLDGIRHLMVDEFQDTNQVQQAIVYALAHPGNPGRLFVVGDAKQSIYRFRQAQVAVFNRTAHDIQRATGCPPVPLSCSFRTHEQLVTALNELFDTILRPLGETHTAYEAHPGPLQPQRLSPDGQPAVELLLLPEATETGEPVNAEDCRIFEAHLLAEKLLALQAQGFPVWDRDNGKPRPFRFDDAAILFRSTTSMALYEEQFKAAGLPYLTISGRGYYDRPEVRDLIALLQALYNPADDLNLAAALRSPLFNLSDDTLYALRWHTPGQENAPSIKSDIPISYRTALTNPPPTGQAEAVAFAASVMQELWSMTGRVEVWRLLRAALDRTGFEATLALSDRERRSGGRQRSNIAKFLDLARQDNGASLSEFLRTIADLRASEAREGEGLADAPDNGAVQLMSIHASKGLEFPVVVVADIGRGQRRGGATDRLLTDPAFGLVCMQRDPNGDWQKPAGYIWANWLNERMERAESRRLLYVACTRAADLLILAGQTGEKDSWLVDVCQAWKLENLNGADEVVQKNGYAIHVRQPTYRDVEVTHDKERPIQSPVIDLPEMPPFALPLPVLRQSLPVSVTHLERLLDGIHAENETGEEESLSLLPAVREEQPGSARVPAYLIGRVVHRALADWLCLEMPQAELAHRVAAYAQREGITSPQAIDYALHRCGRILENLRETELYEEICSAQQRYSEVPFTLTTSLGVLHGVIDLIYQDQDGIWHLIDWKSEWVPREQLQMHAEQHRLQLAVYAEAARRTLGIYPRVAACFLAVGGRVWRYAEEELQEVFQQIAFTAR